MFNKLKKIKSDSSYFWGNLDSNRKLNFGITMFLLIALISQSDLLLKVAVLTALFSVVKQGISVIYDYLCKGYFV